MHSSTHTVGVPGVGPAAGTQYSGTRKRCISSLQVTYHQEIHRPSSQVAVNQLTPSLGGPYSGSAPREYGLGEGAHSLKEGRIVPDEEEQDFYGPPPLPVNSWEPPCKPQQGHPPRLSPPPPPPSCQFIATTSQSPLFRFEDGLRHKVNVEIENFRSSLQEVMREQFTSHRYHQSQHSLKEELQDYPIEAVNQLDDAGQSIETSVDSGVYGEVSVPTAVPVVEETPTTHSVEKETNLALIRLQTLASFITTNLQSAYFNISK